MRRIHFLPDEMEVELAPKETILDASLRAGIAHAHACGGYARCSTCRVWILEGLEHCRPRNELERMLAERLRFNPRLRLACQTVVNGEVKVRRLVLDEEDLELTNQLGRKVIGTVGEEKEVAIMFADIRDFTAFSEALPPYDVIYVLDRFFHQMGRVIYSHGGYVQNYMGDGLLAIFGADNTSEAPIQAIRAGLQMLAALEGLKPYVRATYEQSFDMGIGLHYGPAVLGTMGYGDSRELTAIGDAVNFASRVESANKVAGTRFLISGSTYEMVRDQVEVGRTVTVDVKGKTGKFTLYEVVGIRGETETKLRLTADPVTNETDGLTWVRVLPEAELPPDGRQVVTLDEQPILLINHENQIYAIESRCPHMSLPLKGARISEDLGLVCPWHHSAFDLQTGDVKAWAPWPPVVGPALGLMRRKRLLHRWPTRVVDGFIWVALGEAVSE